MVRAHVWHCKIRQAQRYTAPAAFINTKVFNESSESSRKIDFTNIITLQIVAVNIEPFYA